MGLPNATSVQQEMDALFGAFKAATYARGEMLLTERLRDRGLQNIVNRLPHPRFARGGAIVPVSISFADLPVVVNGKECDDIDAGPFNRHFLEAKILTSWAKVGFVTFTRKCVFSKKVWHELGPNGSLVEGRGSFWQRCGVSKTGGDETFVRKPCGSGSSGARIECCGYFQRHNSHSISIVTRVE